MAETISSFLIAAKRGDIRTANALLLEKPSVINETLSLTGANALYISCQNNHENILKLLLSKKNWNMQSTVNDGTTPLYIAAKSGHIRIAKILIERCSADINYSCQRNTFITPLHVACLSRKIEMVKYLIHSGCNIDKPKIDGKTPLITSVLLESVSLVKILLENGANKNIKDLSNTSALEYAKKLNNKTLVSLLSDVKKTTSSSGLSAGNIYDSKNLAVDIQNVSGVYYKNAEIAVEKDTIATTDGSGCLRNNKSTVNKTIIPSATNKKPLVSGRVTSPTKSGLPNNRKLPNSNHPNSSKDILLSKNKPISETKKTSNLKATPAIKPFPIKRLPQKIFPLEKLNCTQQIIKKTNNQNLIFQKEIGKGGFGIVFKGLYKNKVCAIKKINLKLDNENKLEVLKNFLKEAQVMQSMKHENIVKFIDFDLESFSIIMEYMELGSLDEYIYNNPTMNWIDRYQMMIDISTGMEFLHSKSFPNGGAKQDVFHQDLKSGNIQLYSKNKSLRAKISDFGLSILRDYSFVSENLLRSHYSHENLSVVNLNGWTEEYKAPELQSDTAQFTKLCDVYSFGIILLELITLNQSNSKLVKTLKSSLHLLKFGKLEICNSLGYILEKSLNLNYKLRLPFKNLRILILSEKIEIIKYFSTNDGIFKCKIEYEDVL